MNEKEIARKQEQLIEALQYQPEYVAPLVKESFYAFVRFAWKYAQNVPFVDGYHIHAISEHLQALQEGQIRNLIISVPPRHTKTTLASVLFPSWIWVIDPAIRFLAITQKVPLTIRDSLAMRRLVQTDWFQRIQPLARLTTDQFAKARFENISKGGRVSTSVAGYKTGEGGDYIIVDDPQDVKDVLNPDALEETNDILRSALATRIINPATARRLTIAQRIHSSDFTGMLLEEQGDRWCHLVLPAEWDGIKRQTVIGWEEQRTLPNQLLWPERFTRADIEKLKIDLGTDAAGQLQQNPVAAGATIFDKSWWDVAENPASRFDIRDIRFKRRVLARYVFWDTALKDGEENDYTARLVIGVLDDLTLIVLDARQWRVQSPELVQKIKDAFTEVDFNETLKEQVIEDKGSGTTAIQTVKRMLPDSEQERVKAWLPKGSKTYRAKQAAIYCSQGLIKLPLQLEGVDWLMDFEETLYGFPRVKHDDLVDAFTMGILYLENVLQQAIQQRLMGLDVRYTKPIGEHFDHQQQRFRKGLLSDVPP